MQTSFSLKYRGPAVEQGVMDVYQAAANMIAFSDFVVEAAKATFGPQVDARAQVSGFARGSFVTDIIFNVAGPIASVLGAVSPEQLLKVINEAITLWKHLKGAPPAKVEHSRDNQSVHVTNNNGQILEVQIQSLTVVFNDKAAESASRFIGGELKKPGIDAVEIGAPDGVIAVVQPPDAESFGPVRPSETVTDQVIKMSLIIEAPVFKDGNKWRFSDGGGSFYANIQDEDFLTRVDAGEPFSKGDVLVVEMRIVQERSGMRLSAERSVVRVIEHRQRSEQANLFG